jgi:D-glycero-D-manno-heptose 1,7-bisphosphate phosphatase
MTSPAVFLDRDGVLNETGGGDRSPRTLDEIRVAPTARAVVGRLRDAGFVTIIVTNQPDVARGLVTGPVAIEINETIRSAVGADGAYLCEHSSEDGCTCRKPLPGQLLEAAADHGIDLAASWLIGDRWVDIQAARAAGVRSVLLERSYSWASTSAGAPPPDLHATEVADSLIGCADLILGRPGAATTGGGASPPRTPQSE